MSIDLEFLALDACLESRIMSQPNVDQMLCSTNAGMRKVVEGV